MQVLKGLDELLRKSGVGARRKTNDVHQFIAFFLVQAGDHEKDLIGKSRGTGVVVRNEANALLLQLHQAVLVGQVEVLQ